MAEFDRRLGSRYELVERIGSGATGQVWRARVVPVASSRRPKQVPDVAAKLLRGDLITDPDVVRRFIQERSVVMGLDHPGIVKVVDMVAEGDRLAIVMELMPGGPLSEHLSRVGTLPAGVAVTICGVVLDGLCYAHGKGVLHRDVKPSNVLLGADGLASPESARLSDFGIAALMDERGVHVTGLVGSPAYMPPELFTTGVVSAASDVYAAGVMLYELLAGRTPFAGAGTSQTVAFRHVTAAAPVLPVDGRLWRVVEGMLAKDPVKRLSAQGAAEALRSLPGEALSTPALPVQVTPDWAAMPVFIGQPQTIQALDGSVDVGHTRMAGLSDLAPVQLPETRPAQPVVVSGGDVDISSTRLAGLERPQADEEVATGKRRSVWVVAAIVVAVVLVLAGGGVAVMRFGAGHVTAPPTVAYTPAHVTGKTAATGFRMDFDAAGSDDSIGGVDLTMTFSAPLSTGLSGEVLVVLPAADDGACPSVDDSSVVVANQSSDGVSAACGMKLAVTLGKGDVQSVTWHVGGAIGADLASWIKDIDDQTAQALGDVTGSGFALQRVQGISVQADSMTRMEAAPAVQYRVFARWSNGEEELFSNNTLTFQATDLLLSLTGGDGLPAVKVASCPETLVRDTTVLALQPASSCFVQVTVGELVSQQASFSISTSGS
ncbi:MAG: serine/threonine protein kinase [Propionibacteriaceae bacterium]|nr:serine/threonine protein kinase [Propionibacteriaceae bacterium]